MEIKSRKADFRKSNAEIKTIKADLRNFYREERVRPDAIRFRLGAIRFL